MKKEDMNIVIVGHVDHGKSTLMGRLLADTFSLPEGKLEQVKETCRRNSKPFEYAFLLDALKDERYGALFFQNGEAGLYHIGRARTYRVFEKYDNRCFPRAGGAFDDRRQGRCSGKLEAACVYALYAGDPADRDCDK